MICWWTRSETVVCETLASREYVGRVAFVGSEGVERTGRTSAKKVLRILEMIKLIRR